MSARAACPTCGFTSTASTPGMVAYAMRRHSCEKWLTRKATAEAFAARLAAGPKRECHHKVADHRHGTRSAYVLDRCRCQPCRKASVREEKRRLMRIAAGQPSYVDARPAVAHVRRLQDAGLGWKRAAELAGINTSSIYPLLYGRTDRNDGRPRTKARATTVQAILAVPVPAWDQLAGGAQVDAAGTRRRLQALATLGWSVATLAARGEVDRQPLDHAMHAGAKVQVRTARAVRDLYDHLWDKPAPTGTKGERITNARTRNTARREGWLPPLAWDDDVMDDPEAGPAVEAIGHRHPLQRLTVEDIEFLLTEHPALTAQQLADRLGVTREGVRYHLARHERTDLLAQLARNQEVAA